MHIVHLEDVPLENRTSGGRAGTWQRRRVMQGQAGLENFSLVLYYHDGSFRSPRHHHNFDQFRYQLEGTADFDRNGIMKPGVLGYFPEGAYYGPTSGPAHTVAVLQFAGPSGSGYMGSRQGVIEEMRQFGTFEKGVFRRHEGVEGKKNQDSYEAIWEHVNKRELAYPTPQYDAPVMIDSNAFPWIPVEDFVGVDEKALGTFTSTSLRAARFKLAPGARFALTHRGIYMILSGAGDVNGLAYRQSSTIYLEEGEEGVFVAGSETDILLMGMSRVSRMGSAATSHELQANE